MVAARVCVEGEGHPSTPLPVYCPPQVTQRALSVTQRALSVAQQEMPNLEDLWCSVAVFAFFSVILCFWRWLFTLLGGG